ncbi:ferredoxin [Thalassotalea sp. 42_200_T64]|nr:ferredoxin [Thalassotalea sp. 42_200_T64]
MAQWIEIFPASELKSGMHAQVDLAELSLLLVNIDGEIYAIENVCSHDGGELNDGQINGFEITCPRHGARFNLKTGAVLCAPAFEDINTYRVRIINGLVQVYDEENSK